MRELLFATGLSFNQKKIVIVSLLLVALLNYFNLVKYPVLSYLSFGYKLFFITIGTLWAILVIWSLIWFTKPREGI